MLFLQHSTHKDVGKHTRTTTGTLPPLKYRLFVHLLDHLFCYITTRLMTDPLRNGEFCYPRISTDSSGVVCFKQFTLRMVSSIQPLRLNSDLSQTSHCNITSFSVDEVMRIENMISQVKSY